CAPLRSRLGFAWRLSGRHVGHTGVKHVEKREREAVSNLCQVLECYWGLVELAVRDPVRDQPLDSGAKLLGRYGSNRAGDGLDTVGQRNDGALLELGLRPVVAERRVRDGRGLHSGKWRLGLGQ